MFIPSPDVFTLGEEYSSARTTKRNGHFQGPCVHHLFLFKSCKSAEPERNHKLEEWQSVPGAAAFVERISTNPTPGQPHPCSVFGTQAAPGELCCLSTC